jgi:hypothetical protein
MRYIEMEIRHVKKEPWQSWEKPTAHLHWKHHVIFGQLDAFYKETTNALTAPGILPPQFLSMLGIDRFSLKTEHDLDPLFNLSEQLMPHMPQKWKFFQTADVIAILTSFFEKCSIISLSDLEGLDNSKELWRGIVQDILKPMGRTDLKVIIDSSKIPRYYTADLVANLLEEISRHVTVSWTDLTPSAR